jgi:hypothetical protein
MHADRLELSVTNCYGVVVMLAVFLVVCPVCIVGLFGFARRIDPQTGQFKR